MKKGDLGGFVESEDNLSQDGTAWIFDNAQIDSSAWVHSNAMVCDNARISDNAEVCGNTTIWKRDNFEKIK